MRFGLHASALHLVVGRAVGGKAGELATESTRRVSLLDLESAYATAPTVKPSEGKSLALIIDFAETLVPGGEMSHLSTEDRFVLATLEKWGHDPQFLAGDMSVVLLAENLADVSQRLTRNPYVATIELPLPTEEERLEYVRYKLEGKKLAALSDVPLTGLAKMTAGLSRINNIDRKIITIEDPVEYLLPGVNQIQVSSKTGLTFARGLRAILRHDPDVVLIGEIRDKETAEIAVQASLTGHLVFSTLHTNDAPGATARLIDMGVEPYLVASSLELVMAQRLVRLICQQCKTEVPAPDMEQFREDLGGEVPDKLWRGRGCRHCQGTGYRGRQGVFEMMPVTEEVRAMTLRLERRPDDGWLCTHLAVL